MFQSLIIYGFLGLSLWWLGLIAGQREKNNLKKGYQTPFFTWEILLSLLLFSLVSGIRWNVGTDYLNYLDFYRNLINGTTSRIEVNEVGFLLISNFFASLNIHFTFYFAFFAFLQLFFIYYTFRRERYLLIYLGILILFGDQFLLWMNGLRQTIAACIFVYSLSFIKSKEYYKYLLAISLAVIFHKSAILLFIFLIIPVKDYFKNRIITILILIASVYIGMNPYWFTIGERLSSLVAFINTESRASMLNYFFENPQYLNFGPRRIILLSLNIILALFSVKLKKYYKNKNFLSYYNLAILGCIYFNLFASAHLIFLRPSYYLIIFLPICLSYLLYYLRKVYVKDYVSYSVYLMIFILSISYLLVAVVATNYDNSISDVVNYKFFWDYT